MKTEASSDDNIDKENENVVDNAIEIKQEIDDEDNHKKTRQSSNMSSTNKSPKNCAKRKRGSAQCSKIGKKCNFKSTKTHFMQFQNWQKINFCTSKKFKTTINAILNFFLVQKLIFCHF